MAYSKWLVELINLRFLALFRDFKLKIILGTFHTSCSACTKCLSLCKMLNLLVYGVTFVSSNFKNLSKFTFHVSNGIIWDFHNVWDWQNLRFLRFCMYVLWLTLPESETLHPKTWRLTNQKKFKNYDFLKIYPLYH